MAYRRRRLAGWLRVPSARLLRGPARPADPPARVAVIGLGAGSLAWYARAGDEWDFFEIDPVVIRAATMPGLFCAGESFSVGRQAWVEGALEHAEALWETHLKG